MSGNTWWHIKIYLDNGYLECRRYNIGARILVDSRQEIFQNLQKKIKAEEGTEEVETKVKIEPVEEGTETTETEPETPKKKKKKKRGKLILNTSPVLSL